VYPFFCSHGIQIAVLSTNIADSTQMGHLTFKNALFLIWIKRKIYEQ